MILGSLPLSTAPLSSDKKAQVYWGIFVDGGAIGGGDSEISRIRTAYRTYHQTFAIGEKVYLVVDGYPVQYIPTTILYVNITSGKEYYQTGLGTYAVDELIHDYELKQRILENQLLEIQHRYNQFIRRHPVGIPQVIVGGQVEMSVYEYASPTLNTANKLRRITASTSPAAPQGGKVLATVSTHSSDPRRIQIDRKLKKLRGLL